jgi:hypothetical protein
MVPGTKNVENAKDEVMAHLYPFGSLTVDNDYINIPKQ